MNPYLILLVVGILFILIFGGISLLRREGLSGQFALEVLVFTALVIAGAMLTNTVIQPVIFLIFVYLISMRCRLLVDLANLLSGRGRQRDAISILQFAMRLFPDRSTRLVILVNMGIVQLRRENPKSAQEMFELALAENEEGGGLGVKYEAACRYNLGLALMRQGKEAQAVQQFSEATYVFPSSIYARAAEAALEKRRSGRKKSEEELAEED